jgi:hypothetical protein
MTRQPRPGVMAGYFVTPPTVPVPLNSAFIGWSKLSLKNEFSRRGLRT